MHRFIFLGTLGAALIVQATACSVDCEDNRTCAPPGAASGASGDGGTGATAGMGGGGEAQGGGGTAGDGGAGGGEPCGGCSGAKPYCDEASDECVACLADGHCTEPGAAKCDGGACVPCDDSAQCAGIDDAGVCSAGTCVECALGEEGACGEGQTCDLLAKACVDVAPGSVQNCKACSHDIQCQEGHRCIAMEFPEGTPHGHYCLKQAPPCTEPWGAVLNQPSLGGAAASNYCGIDPDLTTCEAVLALVNNWRCTGTDGMCGPLGEAEIAVPGSICREVGAFGDRCTYACAGSPDCPPQAAQSTCGEGDTTPPGWCGG